MNIKLKDKLSSIKRYGRLMYKYIIDLKSNILPLKLKISNMMKAFPVMGKWLIVGATCIVLLTTGFWGYGVYNDLFQNNVRKTGILYIPSGSDFKQVLDSLKHGDYLKNRYSFQSVASRKNYPEKVLSGAYLIKSGWSNNQLIRLCNNIRE